MEADSLPSEPIYIDIKPLYCIPEANTLYQLYFNFLKDHKIVFYKRKNMELINIGRNNRIDEASLVAFIFGYNSTCSILVPQPRMNPCPLW